MLKKSALTLFLSCLFIVINVLSVFAIATPSNVQVLTGEITPFATTVASPLQALVNGTWQTLYYSDNSLAYVYIPSNATQVAWVNSNNRHLRLLIDSSDLARFKSMIISVYGANDVLMGSYTDSVSHFFDDNGKFQLGVHNPYHTNVHIALSPADTSIYVGVSTSYAPPEKLYIGGVYDSSDSKFWLKTVDNSGQSMYPRSYVYNVSEFYSYIMTSGGILKKGYEYSFTFYSTFGTGLPYHLRTVGDEGVISHGVANGNYVTYTFTPDYDMNTGDLWFYVYKGANNFQKQGAFYYLSSSSTYIPASDSGQQGQVTAANTTVIKNVVTNISNIVSNISNQITNTTTTITNTITNTANQISNAVSQSADNITQSQNANTGKLTDKLDDVKSGVLQSVQENNDKNIQAQDNNADKIMQNQKENTDKLNENQDKNTDKILNSYDSSKLDDSSNDLNDTLTKYDELENTISESMGSYFDDFEYKDISGYPSGALASVLFFGNYLQSIFESIGDFNLPITLGLTLTFVLMLIGYFRYGR